jgi:hypothetical protein
MHYEVQYYTIAHGWRNEWFYDDGNGGVRAETFGTLAEAWAAVAEFFADLAEDVAAGYCPPCDRAEFRVWQVGGTSGGAS